MAMSNSKSADRRELATVFILTLVIAFMDITGFPSSLFVNIQIADINPMYFTLMANFILIGLLAFVVLKFFCPTWYLGFTSKGLLAGLKKYGIVGVIVALIGFIAFYVGLRPFDLKPSFVKVLVEGVVYYIGVAVVEELYIRGLLLNLIERLFSKSKHNTLIAIVLSSVIFGLGHIFGVIGQPILVIVSKVTWTIGMGLFFGMIYKKTNNLWLPIILHFLINVCALPASFSSTSGYADLTLYIILPTYLLLGAYSLLTLRKESLE
ncbi:MAG: type II CAAX endopeptidase family protein [Eubacteriales bacterium]|nr:type II CAAX endopeptidase family protein [Eubacteriales bacterium]MDD4541411.1 type II CAAX endopeptidase family protein [Eubacteriales bacterium]